MRSVKRLILWTIPVCALAIVCWPVMAFHDGGVAHCNGCHTMHNSENGVAMNYDADGNLGGTAPFTGYTNLLLFQNSTDVCLRCHAGNNTYHVWADDVLVPGTEHGAGNFVFLEEDNINDGRRGGALVGECVDGAGDPLIDPGTGDPYDVEADCTGAGGTWNLVLANAIPGYAAGHSLVSGIKNTGADPVLGLSPGGGFLSGLLNCSSCHDPHGNSSFRLLYQAGQSPAVGGITYQTTLEAIPIPVFGPSENNGYHNSYKAGYSEWCGTCHAAIHANGGNVHPTPQVLGSDEVDSYNLYYGTTDCVNNPPGTAGLGLPCGSGGNGEPYLAAVPYEDPDIDSTAWKLGPDTTNSQVVCVTCHRAHASSAPNAGRWEFDVTGLAEDGDESGSYPIPNPYDEFQRSLCNKCHSQDEYDELVDFTPTP